MEKKPARLKWFALHVDAFLEDPRMQHLTETQKAQWALILIKSFRNQGTIITKPEIVANQVGCKLREAKELIVTLFTSRLIIPIENRLYEAFSPKLSLEYEKAFSAYESSTKGGKIRQENAERNESGRLV